ncbi:RebB family R body protein [Marinomonas mediterranea]|uniref:RebB family R body protein n=1 Tax=Marinomonas mediterranea TaxID=119864 RepID=UPI0023499021|nr:RebB family R body protein [Marinomonas mediterranea]WCN09853.1 hypothetical protein GV055_13475 [Marinomonas mediterranea]WCN13937.1 hypothetical protein GV054_13490 [Marinomonas mediterranea]
MKQQDTRFQNEFEYELPQNAMDDFNTLQSFSAQPTTLLETTLTDTLGLSMHNAVTNQQQSQMTTAASVTNACARLLQTKSAEPIKVGKESKHGKKAPEEAASFDVSSSSDSEDSDDVNESEDTEKKSGFFRFFFRSKRSKS